MEWEIGAECLACVLIVLVLCFSREKFYTQMPQTRLYYACLGFALFSTLLNIATVVLMGVPGLLPRWLCYTLNMLYFTFFLKFPDFLFFSSPGSLIMFMFFPRPIRRTLF